MRSRRKNPVGRTRGYGAWMGRLWRFHRGRSVSRPIAVTRQVSPAPSGGIIRVWRGVIEQVASMLWVSVRPLAELGTAVPCGVPEHAGQARSERDGWEITVPWPAPARRCVRRSAAPGDSAGRFSVQLAARRPPRWDRATPPFPAAARSAAAPAVATSAAPAQRLGGAPDATGRSSAPLWKPRGSTCWPGRPPSRKVFCSVLTRSFASICPACRCART